MKRVIIIAMAVFVVFMGAASIVQADEIKKMNLKFASPWGPHDIAWIYINQPVWDKVSSMTDKKIKLTSHFLSSLYPPDKCWDSTIMGVSDITTGFVGFDAPGRFPISDLFALPRMDQRSLRMATLGYEMLRKWPEIEKEYQGAKMLWVNALSYLWFGSTKKPILSVEDFKGLKVAAPSRWQGKVLAALGMKPVPIPFPDLYMALEKGVIDAMLIDPNLIVKYKFGEVIKYVTDINFGAGTSYGAMNMKSWNKLPPDVKNLIDKMYKEPEFMFDIDSNLMINHYKMVIEAQKSFGTRFYDFPSGEMAKVLKMVQPIRDEYAAFLDSKGYQGKEIMERFDKLNGRYQY